MKQTSLFWAIILFELLSLNSVFATTLSFQNSPSFSIENIEKTMDWFTSEPHPMGSVNQAKIASTIKQTLNHFGWKTSIQKFNAIAPHYSSAKKDSNSKNTINVTGQNIISTLKGKENCSLIIGGHYDTKYFKDIYFVGANDGGSSTVLMLELARILKNKKFKDNSLGSCNITLVFFDGEEAFLPQWSDAERTLNIKDNLYGSRNFTKEFIKQKNKISTFDNNPINLILIIDMIGHKKQKLFITQGSDEKYSKQFINSARNIKINSYPLMIEDDHTPFLSLKLPVLHIIDWENLGEWHTDKDTKNIISYEAIANLGETMVQFLSTPRIQ